MAYEKTIKKIIVTMLVSVTIVCTVGCQKKIPKGMSEEMYGYAKKISVTVHKFLDGEIERSDILVLEELPEKMVDHIKKEDEEIAVAMALAILDDDTLEHPPIEAVFTVDEEIGMLCTELMIYLFTEDNMSEAEDTLNSIDEFLNNK